MKALLNRTLLMFSLALAALAAGTAQGQDTSWQDKPWENWETKAQADNPLVGLVWSVRARGFIRPEDLISDISGVRHVLIGEKHDNPDHHRLQAWILSQSANAGDQVAFEMVPESFEEDMLASWSDEADLNAFAKTLKWEERGWYQFEIYRPIFEAMQQKSALPAAGATDREIERKASQTSFDDLVGAPRALEMALSQPIPGRFMKELRKSIVEGHCNMMEAKDTDPIVNVQRVRDAFLANGLMSPGPQRRFLITGNGHIRRDYGVPFYLRLRGESAGDVVSIGIVEVAEGEESPRQYFSFTGMGSPTLDYVWFTPRVDDLDPCEKFAEQLKKIKKSN